MDDDIIEAETSPVLAVVPVKRGRGRPRKAMTPNQQYRHITPDRQLAMKADYLTGAFDSWALANKYHCPRGQALYFIEQRWKKLLIAAGGEPPQEEKYHPDSEGLYDLIFAEFLKGISMDQLGYKYHLGVRTVEKAAKRYGWIEKRKLLGSKLEKRVTEAMFQKSDQFASRMSSFYDKATEQLGKWIAKFDEYDGDDPLPIKDLEIFTRAFRNMIDSGRLIYNPPQGNGPAINPTPNNPGFVRINVMNGAAVSVAAHQPAKCIEIEG